MVAAPSPERFGDASPRRRTTSRVLAELGIVATSIVTGCTGSTSDATTATTASVTSSSDRAAPAMPRDGEMPGAPHSSRPTDGAERYEALDVTDLDARTFRGSGQHGTIAHVDRLGAGHIAVGDVHDADRDTRLPLVLEALAAGDEWRRATVVVPRRMIGATAATALPTPSGAPLVFGTVWTSAGADGSAWRRDGGRWVPNPLEGDIAADGDQIVDRVAAAEAGWVAIGSDRGDPAVWRSDDGRRWTEIELPVDDDGVELVDVAVDATTIMLIVETTDRSLVLRATGAGDLTVFREHRRSDVRFTSVVPIEAGMAVGGAQMIDGRYSPHVWQVTDDIWPYAATAVPYGPVATNAGVSVDDVVVGADGRLYATAAGAVVEVDGSGVVTTLVDRGPGRASVLSSLAPGGDRSPVVALTGPRRLWALSSRGGGEHAWVDVTLEHLPTATRDVTLAGVAHRNGTWVVAGFIDDGDGRRAATWTSDDAREWKLDDHLATDRQPSALTLSASGDGFVLVGQRPGRLLVWTSPDGTTWKRLESPLLRSPRPGYVQAEWVQPAPDGFIIAGVRFTDTRIEPWVVTARNGVLRAEQLPPVAGQRDSVTAATCGSGARLTVVGSWQRDAAGPAWWTRDGDSWVAESESGATGGLVSCLQVGDRVVAVDAGGSIVELGDQAEEVARLPRGAVVSDLTMSRLGERLVVAGNHRRGTDPRLWVSTDLGARVWAEVRPTTADVDASSESDESNESNETSWSADAGRPGARSVVGVTTAGDRLVMAIDDGVSGRLVAVHA